MLTIQELSGNLIELANADELVPNWAGTRIYGDSRGWGKLWSWIYKLSSLFGFKNQRSDSLYSASVKTEQAFTRHLKELSEDLGKYQRYIGRSIHGYSGVEDPHAVKGRITSWNIHLTSVCKTEKISRLFEDALCADGQSANLLERAAGYQHLIDIEGLMGGPLPYAAFERLATGRTCESEETSLSTFFDSWSRARAAAAVDLLTESLHVFTEHVNCYHMDAMKSKADVGRLQWELWKRRPDLFEVADAAQLEWRSDALSKGLMHQGNCLNLTNMPMNKPQSDAWQAFTSDSSDITLIPHSRFLSGVEVYRREDCNCYLSAATVNYQDPHGHYLLVEPLEPASLQAGWPPRWTEWNARVHKRVNKLTHFLGWMLNSRTTPVGLKAELLGWTPDDELKSFRPLTQGPFDFLAIIDFLRDAAADNPELLKKLLEDSNLKSHNAVSLFSEVVEARAKQQQYDLEERAAAYQIGDRRILERARRLGQTITEYQCLDSNDSVTERYHDRGLPGYFPLD